MTAHARLILVLALVCIAGVAGAASAVPAAAASLPGTLVWHHTWNLTTPVTISGGHVAVAGTGDVYVAAVIDRGAGHGFDWVITRYTSAGTRKWVHYVDGTGHGDDYVTAIAAGQSGNVVVCGRLLDAGAAQYDFALACFSQAGTLLWTKRINGSASGMDGAQDLTLDAHGDIYVTGYVANTTTGSDWLTIEYSPTGERVWQQHFDGGLKLADTAYALTLDARGRVYVTGQARIDSWGAGDITLVRYSRSGHLDWVSHGGWMAGWQDCGYDVATNGAAVAVAGVSTYGVLSYAQVYVTDTRGRVLAWYNDGQGAPSGSLFWFGSVGMDDVGDILAGGYAQTNIAAGPDFFCLYVKAYDDTNIYSATGSTDGLDMCNSVLMLPDGTCYATGTVRNGQFGQDVHTWGCDFGWNERFATDYNQSGGTNDQGASLAVRGGYLYVAGTSGKDLLLLKYVR